MLVTTNTDRWSSCAVTGQTPPPCEDFTLMTVGEKRAVMFGGMTGTRTSLSDDLFIVELDKDCMVSVIVCSQ